MPKIVHSILITLVASLLCAGSEVQSVGNSVNEIVDVAKSIQLDAKKRIEISGNIIPSQMNMQVDNSKADAVINKDAYHFELSYLFESKKQDFLEISKRTHAYFALHAAQYVEVGESEDGSLWAETASGVMLIYGHKYYLEERFDGLGYGWYLGLNNRSVSDAYWWDTPDGMIYTYESEGQGLLPIAAAEVFYKLTHEQLFMNLRYAGGINKENFELVSFFQVMVGLSL
jgi:hypothetical protein